MIQFKVNVPKPRCKNGWTISWVNKKDEVLLSVCVLTRHASQQQATLASSRRQERTDSLPTTIINLTSILCEIKRIIPERILEYGGEESILFVKGI
jgi:hypothetical protein